jgi:serine/threonine protein kinase
MVMSCIEKDPKNRPSSADLLDHVFFKAAKNSQFLEQTFKAIKINSL